MGQRHSQKTKKALSEIQKERMKSPKRRENLRKKATEQNKKNGNPMKGKHLSDEEKQHLREKAEEQFSTEESRRKHSEIMREWCTPEMRKRISKTKTGIPLSEETVEKIKKASKNTWDSYTEEQRQERLEKMKAGAVKSRAKTYKGLISPDGVVYENIYNLAEFCRQHNLSSQQMSAVVNGRRKHYKGWRSL